MKLSSYTIDILKNFAKIRSSIIIRKGSYLITKNETGEVMAWAALDDSFPENCCIFDLNVFLSIITMFNDNETEFDFHPNHINIGNGNTTVKYKLAGQIIYDDMDEFTPKGKPNISNPSFTLELSEHQMKSMIKSASILNLNVISFTTNGVRAYSSQNGSENEYTFKMNVDGDSSVKAVIGVHNFNMLSGNYRVEVYDEYKCVKFINTDVGDLEYIIMYHETGESEND